MSNKSKGDAGEYEFTRAAYDELKEAEAAMPVEFHTELLPTAQRGVWLLVVACRAKGEYESITLVSRYMSTWPNSQVTSFGAFFYGAVHRCVRMAEAWHAERERQEAAQ